MTGVEVVDVIRVHHRSGRRCNPIFEKIRVIVMHHRMVEIISIGLRQVFVAEHWKKRVVIIHHSTLEIIVKFNLLEDVIAEKKMADRRRRTIFGSHVPEEERTHLPMEIRMVMAVLIVVRDIDETTEEEATDEFVATIRVQVLMDRRSN